MIAMNWLDILILLVITLSVVSGFTQGFVRIGIGFGALVSGFLLASWFYGLPAAWFADYFSSRSFANIAGFVLIFAGVMILGALLASALSRVLKIAGLSWADRLFGAGLGFIRGLVVVVIGLMILTAFTPRPPAAVVRSQVAPHAMRAARVLSTITPFEIKNGFHKRYSQLDELWRSAARSRR